MTKLDDRLAALGRAPVPPLAGAVAARARGEQRTRRAHAAYAGVGALVVVLAVAGGISLLNGNGQPDVLDQATAAPTAPTAPTAPSSAPSPSSGPDPWQVDAALLSPETLDEVETPGWEITPEQAAPAPVLDPCGAGAPPLQNSIEAQAERVLGSEREAGGSAVDQEVYRYDSETSAKGAFTEYLARVEQCPEAPNSQGGPDDTLRYAVATVADDGASALVRVLSCYQGNCPDHFATYVLLAQSRDGLTAATYGISEDGDPRDAAEEILAAMAERLAEVTSPDAEEVPSETQEILLAPADEPYYFRSPSGRISCELTGTQAACDILGGDDGYTYTPPARPEDCEFDWGQSVVVDRDSARFVCVSDTVYSETADVLAYGQSVTNGAFTCTSRETGVTCETADGGHGFELARAQYRLY